MKRSDKICSPIGAVPHSVCDFKKVESQANWYLEMAKPVFIQEEAKDEAYSLAIHTLRKYLTLPMFTYV